MFLYACVSSVVFECTVYILCVEGMYIVCALLYRDYTDFSHIKKEFVFPEMVRPLVD